MSGLGIDFCAGDAGPRDGWTSVSRPSLPVCRECRLLTLHTHRSQPTAVTSLTMATNHSVLRKRTRGGQRALGNRTLRASCQLSAATARIDGKDTISAPMCPAPQALPTAWHPPGIQLPRQRSFPSESSRLVTRACITRPTRHESGIPS